MANPFFPLGLIWCRVHFGGWNCLDEEESSVNQSAVTLVNPLNFKFWVHVQ